MTLLTTRDIAFIGGLVAAIIGIMLVGITTTYAAVTTTLSPGSSGPLVSDLQTFLATDSSVYPEGLVTGFYGDLTTAAVQRFQCKYSIVCSGDAASTGYGNVGPATLAKIESLQGGTTSSGSSSGSIDVNAPVLSWPTVATSSTSATVHWTTNEPAQSRLMYSTTPPALSYDAFAAMPSVGDPTFDMSSDVVIAGLAPNTRYYYVLESTDASSNVQYGIEHSFVTNP